LARGAEDGHKQYCTQPDSHRNYVLFTRNDESIAIIEFGADLELSRHLRIT
jgi:hypothetical protein